MFPGTGIPHWSARYTRAANNILLVVVRDLQSSSKPHGTSSRPFTEAETREGPKRSISEVKRITVPHQR